MVELEDELKNLKEPEDEILYKPIDPKTTYDFISKIINHKNYKKSQKEYVLQKEEYERTIIKVEENKKQYFSRKDELEKRIKELKSIWENKQLEDVRKQYKKIKEANNINELGYSFEQIQELFKQKNVPLVLDENDKIIENESNFDKLDDLVLVHKTSYAPTNNEIKTTTNSNAYKNQSIKLGNETLDINFKLYRNTVHFAVNGEVSSHAWGNWDDCKYAIIIPIREVKNINTFNVVDTYTVGNVDISKGYILCPEEQIDKVKKDNPDTCVIGYKGTNVNNFANVFITMLGYKQKNMNQSTWSSIDPLTNKDVANVYTKIIPQTNFKIGDHTDASNERQEEKIFDGINQLIAIIEKLKEKNDIEIFDILNNLINNNQLLLSEYTFIKDDGKYFFDLIEKLKDFDLNIPEYVKDIYTKSKNRDSFDDIIKDISNNELKESINNYKEKVREYWWFDTTKIVFIYEILMQIKELNKNNLKDEEIEKHGLVI